MQFTIRPHQPTFDLILETGRYQRLWEQHGEAILQAFSNVTGLEFQQDVITAEVFPDQGNDSGGVGEAMHLSGMHPSEHRILETLIHELAHRLLGGNALWAYELGLVAADAPEALHSEYNHRLIYLFLYDVMEQALGEPFATVFKEREDNDLLAPPDYRQAWQWAMSLNHDERQQAVQRLAAQKFTRDRWHERDADYEPPRRDAEAWFAHLL